MSQVVELAQVFPAMIFSILGLGHLMDRHSIHFFLQECLEVWVNLPASALALVNSTNFAVICL